MQMGFIIAQGRRVELVRNVSGYKQTACVHSGRLASRVHIQTHRQIHLRASPGSGCTTRLSQRNAQ